MTLALAAAVVVAAAPAGAHTGVLGARAPVLESGGLMGGSTTWGVVLADDGTFLRVCDEAPAMLASFHVRVGARVLVGGGPGLLATDDQGCSYQPRALGGATDASAAVVAGGHVYVATGRPGFPNAVFVSLDDGLTFAPTALAGTASPLWELVAAPSGSVLVVSGDDLDLEAPLLRSSLDQGAHWSAGPVDLSPYASVRALWVDDAGSEVLVAAVEHDETPWLLSLDATLALREAIPAPRALTHAVRKGGALFAVADTEALVVRASGGGDFVASDVLVACLLLIDDVLWACGATLGPLRGVHFATSSDGAAWTPVLYDLDVRERSCPEGTPGHDLCVRYQDAGPAPDAGGDAGADDDDSGSRDAGGEVPDAGDLAADAGSTDVPAPSCGGCAGAPVTLAWAPVLAVGLVLSARWACRRRRPRWASSSTGLGRTARDRW